MLLNQFMTAMMHSHMLGIQGPPPRLATDAPGIAGEARWTLRHEDPRFETLPPQRFCENPVQISRAQCQIIGPRLGFPEPQPLRPAS